MSDKPDVIKETKEGDVVTNPGSVLGWVEKMTQMLEKHGPVKILSAILFLAILCSMAYVVLVNPEHMFKLYDKYKNSAHQELIVQRLKNTPLIQEACDELLMRTQADRVLFLELHNNTGNISGMPFYYASASCESLDDGIRPIADQYSEVKLSLIPFATKLFEDQFWSGDMDSLLQFDKSLYYKMMSNEAHHVAFNIVQGVDFPCGMLVLTFQKNPEKAESHNCARTRFEIERTSRKIALYVEAPGIQK